MRSVGRSHSKSGTLAATQRAMTARWPACRVHDATTATIDPFCARGRNSRPSVQCSLINKQERCAKQVSTSTTHNQSSRISRPSCNRNRLEAVARWKGAAVAWMDVCFDNSSIVGIRVNRSQNGASGGILFSGLEGHLATNFLRKFLIDRLMGSQIWLKQHGSLTIGP